MLSEEQKRSEKPFIRQLAQHMMLSYEQGIKIQVSEFFKVLIDNEQTEKKVEFHDLFYQKVLMLFTDFLNLDNDIVPGENDFGLNYAQVNQYNQALEYSRSLILQIIIKCA